MMIFLASLFESIQVRDWISLFSIVFAISVALLANVQSLMRSRLDDLLKQQVLSQRLDDLTNRIATIEAKLEKLLDLLLERHNENKC